MFLFNFGHFPLFPGAPKRPSTMLPNAIRIKLKCIIGTATIKKQFNLIEEQLLDRDRTTRPHDNKHPQPSHIITCA